MTLTRLFAILVLIVATACSDPAASSQQLESREAFRERFLTAVSAAHPGVRVKSATEDTIVLEGPHGEDQHIYLGNAYGRHREGQPAEEAVAALVALVNRQTPPFRMDQAYLLVRPTSYLQEVEKTAPVGGVQRLPVTRPLAGDLLIFIGQDQGDAFSYPLREDIEKEVPDVDTAWTQIAARTEAAFGEIQLEPLNERVSLLSANEEIGASLMASPTVWSEPSVRGVGRRIAIVVFRDALILTNADDARGVQDLRALLRRSADSPNLLSDHVFVRENGQWSVLESE